MYCIDGLSEYETCAEADAVQICGNTSRSIYQRKYKLQITQPFQYGYTQLQYGFAVISKAPTMWNASIIENEVS